MREQVWFWQRIVSPHMAGLAEALAKRGASVTYVAEMQMSAGRTAQGWEPPKLVSARLRVASDVSSMVALAMEAPPASLHICQGLRGNGPITAVQDALRRRHLGQWAILETIKEQGWLSAMLKRGTYRRILAGASGRLEGFLAIGSDTPQWLIDRGAPSERVFPFTYFLADMAASSVPQSNRLADAPFRILYAGRLIDLKRVDTLIGAIARVADLQVELVMAGAGPLEGKLRQQADRLGVRVRWLGQLSINQMPALMAEADCLVLPSRYDGWGAVVSEALMVGTQVICSDRCGARVAVLASGKGGVFRVGDESALAELVGKVVAAGRPGTSERHALATWAQCLGADAGSRYLEAILSMSRGAARPLPPWEVVSGGESLSQRPSQIA